MTAPMHDDDRCPPQDWGSGRHERRLDYIDVKELLRRHTEEEEKRFAYILAKLDHCIEWQDEFDAKAKGARVIILALAGLMTFVATTADYFLSHLAKVLAK